MQQNVRPVSEAVGGCFSQSVVLSFRLPSVLFGRSWWCRKTFFVRLILVAFPVHKPEVDTDDEDEGRLQNDD